MGVMKIVDGPRYKKTGSPTQKQQRRAQRIASLIFAELLPHTTKSIKRAHAEPLREDEKKLVSLRYDEEDLAQHG